MKNDATYKIENIWLHFRARNTLKKEEMSFFKQYNLAQYLDAPMSILNRKFKDTLSFLPEATRATENSLRKNQVYFIFRRVVL